MNTQSSGALNVTESKEALVDRYALIVMDGFPLGTLPPLRRWVKALAAASRQNENVLFSEIRVAALDKIKLQARA